MSRLHLQVLPGETRAFLLDGDELLDLAYDHGEGGPRADDLYLGRVTRLEARLGGAFLDIGLPEAGFLPLAEAPVGLSEGDALTLRLLRLPAEGKGARLTTRLPSGAAPPPAGARPPLLLRRGPGPLEALLARAREAACDDAATAARLRARGLATTYHRDGFPAEEAAALDALVEGLLRPEVPLPGGGSLLIEPVRTLTAIDVNQGARGRGAAAAAALETNLAALPEIARHLRLRSLSGRLVIDFLALQDPAQRQRVETALRQALAADPQPTRVFRMAATGLLELTRRRGCMPLHERLLEVAGPYGGRRKRLGTLAFEALRALQQALRGAGTQPLALGLGSELAGALAGHPVLAHLEERAGRSLPLRPLGEPRAYRILTGAEA